MSWFVCTIGKSSQANWDLCKQAGSYGVPGRRGRPRVQAEDRLLIWIAGRGFKAEAVVTGDAIVPQTTADAPWPGGLYRYGYVVPMRVVLEVRDPVIFPFVNGVQPETGVSTAQLQRSMALIPDSGADRISVAIRERHIIEEASREAHPSSCQS